MDEYPLCLYIYILCYKKEIIVYSTIYLHFISAQIKSRKIMWVTTKKAEVLENCEEHTSAFLLVYHVYKLLKTIKNKFAGTTCTSTKKT